MPRRYQLGGGELVVDEPDPLQVALKQAELYQLQQGPQIERAKLALAQREAEQRGTAASRQLDLDTTRLELEKQKAIEAGDIDRARLLNDQQQLRQTGEYQKGQLGESAADRRSRETLGREQFKETRDVEASRQKGEFARTLVTHLLEREGNPITGPAVGSTGKILAKLGYGEFEKGAAEAGQTVLRSELAPAVANISGLTPDQRKGVLAGMPEERRKVLESMLPATQPTAAPAASTAAPTGDAGFTGGINLRRAAAEVPIGLANLGAGIANYGVLPVTNTIARTLGTATLPPAEYTTYESAGRGVGRDLNRLLRRKPRQPVTQ